MKPRRRRRSWPGRTMYHDRKRGRNGSRYIQRAVALPSSVIVVIVVRCAVVVPSLMLKAVRLSRRRPLLEETCRPSPPARSRCFPAWRVRRGGEEARKAERELKLVTRRRRSARLPVADDLSSPIVPTQSPFIEVYENRARMQASRQHCQMIRGRRAGLSCRHRARSRSSRRRARLMNAPLLGELVCGSPVRCSTTGTRHKPAVPARRGRARK